MANFIEKSDLHDEYGAAQEYARQFFEDFDEYERIGENRIREDLPEELPAVNDGTISALLLEIAMRQFQRLHTGKTISNRAPAWLTELLSVYWTNTIIPNANTQSSFFNKFFNGIWRSGVYGSAFFYAFSVSRPDYSGADFYLPGPKDVYLEKGKLSDRDSNHIWLNQYFTKHQMKSVIAMAEDEEKQAKAFKRESLNPWDITLLKRLVNEHDGGKKDARDQSGSEQRQSIHPDFIKIVKCVNRGFGAPIYSYAPDLGDIKNAKFDRCVGQTINRNPTGELPITGIYHLENLQNPYGKGLVEMGGHMQNVLDELVQNHVLATAIGTRPPISVEGNAENVAMDSLVWDADAIWEVGEAKVKAQEYGTSIYTQFPRNYGLYKTQLLNLLGISDHTVSSESGDPQYSKTPAGVAAQQERTSIHDNSRSKNTDTAFGRLASNLVNLTVAHTQGSKVVHLLEDDIERLRLAGFKDENGNDLDREDVEMVWDRARGNPEDPLVYDFSVDPGSSQSDDSKAKEEAIKEVLTTFAENPQMEQALAMSGVRLDTGELFREYLGDKVKNIAKVLVPIEADEAGTTGGGAIDENSIREVMETFQVDEKTAAIIVEMRAQGMTDEQIADYFNQVAQEKGMA